MADLSALTLVIDGNPTVDVGATGGLDMNNNLLPNLSDPIAPQDAATKEYVDTTVASWTTVLSAQSIVDQGPGATGVIHQIEFGAAQGTGSDPVEIASDGTITFNQAGFYDISTGFTIGRSSGTASAFLIFRHLIDAVPVGMNGTTQLSDNNNFRPTAFSSISGNFTIGQVLTFEMHRSDQGQDDGGLFAIQDTGSLAWGTSPSAIIKINRFNP